MLWYSSFKILVQTSNLWGLWGTKWKFSSQQKLWWRQQRRTKLGLTLELCLMPCLCLSLVPKKSNQGKKNNFEVERLQLPVLICPSQQAVRHVSEWSGSCCSLEILGDLWTPQKGCALLAQVAASLAWFWLHRGWGITILVLPFLCPSSSSCYSREQIPADPEILWVNGLCQVPSGSCCQAWEEKKALSFLRNCMPWKHNSKEE